METIDLKNLNTVSKNILKCEIKDSTGLNDFQKLPNSTGIMIPKVGIGRFRMPINMIGAEGEIRNHDAEAQMYVSLEANKTGVNMSRFCKILQEETLSAPISTSLIKKILTRFRTDLRDDETEDLIKTSFLNLNFKLPFKQKSLKSENWGWQYYDCAIKSIAYENGDYSIKLVMNYEYSSTCPCSLSMAKQYEMEYQQGLTNEGNGIGTAHSQRSNVELTVEIDPKTEFSFNDLLLILRTALPTETQSLVKRADEQAFAILNGSNPMFVEHASRNLSLMLNQESKIIDWNAYIQHFESLHSHNAEAYICKERN